MTAILKIELLDAVAVDTIRRLEHDQHVRVLPDEPYDATELLSLAGTLNLSEAGDALEIQQKMRSEWDRL